LNVLNGTINLRTGALGIHRQEDLITKVIPLNYRTDATCPTWLRFMVDVTDCVFHAIAGTDSTGRRACFPREGGHGFHGKVGAPSDGVMEARPTV
ncbi:MAG TPA: hypothetical protein VIJ94_18700, partial [Caulobacteraceae bacterium]